VLVLACLFLLNIPLDNPDEAGVSCFAEVGINRFTEFVFQVFPKFDREVKPCV